MPENAQAVLERMGHVLLHRGPDDNGSYFVPGCGLALRRLSIIDLTTGQQPMRSPGGRLVVVFNGEIFNYRELRRELEGKGASFHTSSDTEVLAAACECWGDEAVSRLRGQFAFAAYDPAARRLLVGRDHTGIKPFYFTIHRGYFVFGSEIKAILEFPGVRQAVNTAVLPQHMSFLWVPAPHTLFDGIQILEPGHVLTVSAEGVSKRRYWQPDLNSVDETRSEAEWVEILDGELARVVREQLVSDVPLGAFLSGGVDSSTVVHYMLGAAERQVTTYTTTFRATDLVHDVVRSDLEYARLAAKAFGVDHNEIVLEPDIASLLPQVIWHLDEPVADPAAITTYLICKAAKQKCTVMLSGVGGDEVFGGYPRYQASRLMETWSRVPRWFRHALVGWWAGLPRAGASRFVRDLRKFVKSAELPFPEHYFGYLSYYSERELRHLLCTDFDWPGVFAAHQEVLRHYPGHDRLQAAMNLDLMTFLPNLNLLYTDKMSSAASVEVRVPFLDHLLIELVAKIPSRFKLHGLNGKYILKKTVTGKVPGPIVRRRKAGFGAPIGAWIKGELRAMMLDLLSDETVKRRGYFNVDAVRSLVENHLSGREYNANQIWQLMVLELWHRELIDKSCVS
jgi:asparagine synthase (glutamine-hydrolysing)